MLSKEEIKNRRLEGTRKWRVNNRERALESNRRSQKRQVENRKKQAFYKLGNCCSNPECRWVNDDNTKRCRDFRCLQIDHVFGDGNQERNKNNLKDGRKFYQKVIDDVEGRYQILCANCNWIKRYVENSIGGKPRIL